MPKNIVVCSDGTGNTAIKGRGTNVFKLFEAVDLNGHRLDPRLDPQVALYDDGVGTESFKPLRLLGGVTGWGLARNVRHLYGALARVYDQGDRIYLFGFSRGAFTVRSLAGMLTRCGLVDGTRIEQPAMLHKAVKAAYGAYRAGYDSVLTGVAGRLLGRRDRAAAIGALQAKYPVHPEVPIEFIGVWDTVDAVGLPFAIADFFNRCIYQFKFPTQGLSPRVKRACHALSVDDDRTSFGPVLWKETEGDEGRIDQVWFAGAHSNVGGGYPKQGMSLVALEWMLYYAQAAKLRIQPLDLQMFSGHASVDDKMYEPRAGLGIFYRWKPRNITKLCRDNNVVPKIHLSVFERIAHGTDDYSPGNLPADVTVVTTVTGDPGADGAAHCRAAEIQRALSGVPGGRPSALLESVSKEIAAAGWSYWLFVVSWLAILAGAVGVSMEASQSPWTLANAVKGVWSVLADLLLLRFGNLWHTLIAVTQSPWRLSLVLAVVGFLAAWGLEQFADRRMCRAFSEFWHPRQQLMRLALKKAREQTANAALRPSPQSPVAQLTSPVPRGAGN